MSELGLGCLPGKIDVRDYKIKKKIAMAMQYPETYEAKRGPYLKQQGSVGSCVAHATSEVLEAHRTDGEKLSTNFIYGIHKKLYATLGPGMYLRDACNIALNYGDPAYGLCPGNVEVTRVYEIAEEAFANEEVLKDAATNTIDSYSRLKTADDIKFAIMNYGPVLAAIEWYSGNKVKEGKLIKSGNKDGGHAIMLYGWTPEGWLMQNSWGKGWGVNGCCILPYDYKLSEAYAFVPKKNIPSDIIIPKRNFLLDLLYDAINAILNFFLKIKRAFE